MSEILHSNYLFFIVLSLVLNILVSIIMGVKNRRLKIRIIFKYAILESIGIVLGAKILDIIVNYDIYMYYTNNNMFLKILTSGYAFLGGIFGAILSVAIYSIIVDEDFKELCDIFIPNLFLVYSISKLGCFSAGCCRGISIGEYILPIQLIESIIYICIYLFVSFRKDRGNNKIYLSCLLFGFSRFLVEFFRENTGYMYLSISQVLTIVIFIIGIRLYYFEYMKKLNKQRR